MLKKPIKKSSSNQSQIKQAYELVTKDLLANLKKAKDGAIIKIGEVGTFQKKISRVRNTYGVYRYYRINFQASKSKPEPSGLMKMVGQSLPFLPLLFEQFTGQKIPQMGGTMFEIQMTLQQILANQQALNQRLLSLENNAVQQFTALNQQVQSIKSVRLTHQKETKAIDYSLQSEQQ
ncbi:32440_t:CDS:2 [Racocetra persica]|uniref:32440_t:CDS:1 n=1 Tax=Racocetra persica TaxID=160502 RepID=A0ACA9L5J9_9GLOM|nr:32440_t:CDS:2 [Racocetra persica]